MKIQFLLIALVFMSSSAFSADYYICNDGDDANDGTSPEKAVKSHSKANILFKKLKAGESINFCRGGSFDVTEKLSFNNWNCKKELPCKISDYGSSDKEKPIINTNGYDGFFFSENGEADSDGGYIVENLKIFSDTRNGVGIRVFNDVDDLYVNNVHIEGLAIGVYLGGANPAKGHWVNRLNDRFSLTNSTIVKNRKMGFFGGCNDCLIMGNHFEENGTLRVRDHNVYISTPIKEEGIFNYNIEVKDNVLKHSALNEYSQCDGTSLVVHGRIYDLVIDGNQIIETEGKVRPNCWGIGVDPGNETDEFFIGLTIINNQLINVGNTGIGVASAKDVVIKNNLIIDQGKVLRNGISVPDKKSEDSLKSENILITNNLISVNDEWGKGIRLSGQNVFTAENNLISIHADNPNQKCFVTKEANAGTDVSNNICMKHSDPQETFERFHSSFDREGGTDYSSELF